MREIKINSSSIKLKGVYMKNQLLLKEAVNGNSEMQYQLGLVYCFKGDVEQAIYWLGKAKNNNCLKAGEVLEEIEHKIAVRP
jgi:TPR repeat protein